MTASYNQFISGKRDKWKNLKLYPASWWNFNKVLISFYLYFNRISNLMAFINRHTHIYKHITTKRPNKLVDLKNGKIL